MAARENALPEDYLFRKGSQQRIAMQDKLDERVSLLSAFNKVCLRLRYANNRTRNRGVKKAFVVLIGVDAVGARGDRLRQ